MSLGSRVTKLVVAAFVGCSSPSSDATPPSPVDAAIPTTFAVTTFAIDTLVLGDLDPTTHVVDNTGWRTLGYDLDGKMTSKDSTNTCVLAPGAPQDNQVDGDGGRDNSFGANILPIVESLRSPLRICLLDCPDAGARSLSNDESEAIREGQFTLQLQIAGLDSNPGQTASGLTAQVFTSGAFDADGGLFPNFDLSTTWPV